MRDRFGLVMAGAALAACGWLGRKEDARGTSAGSGVQGSGRVAPVPSGPPAGAGGAGAGGAAPWVDPEPPGAQEIAEQVVSAPWNQDKVTQLTMSITTLVDTKTGLQGFRSAVAPTATTLDERLTRLGAEVTGTEVTIRLPGSVLFDFDSAQIRPDAERTLAEVAEVIKGYAKRPVRIEGHTDSVASDDYNQKLSERRAAAVRAWLGGEDVGGARLAPHGFGGTRPGGGKAAAGGPEGKPRRQGDHRKGR